MALLTELHHQEDWNDLQVEGGQEFLRTWEVEYDDTLSDLSLERGDALPGNSNAIVTEATFGLRGQKRSKRIVVVRAFEPDRWSTL